MLVNLFGIVELELFCYRKHMFVKCCQVGYEAPGTQIKVNLQQRRQVNLKSCLQIPRFTKLFVSRKPIKIIQICKMFLKQNILTKTIDF